MTQEQDTAATVPFGRFATFWNYVSGLNGEDLPTRMDRSMLRGKSGTDQKVILDSLIFFGLIDAKTKQVEPELGGLADASATERNKKLEALVRDRYSVALALSENKGTAMQLHESFEKEFGISGDTRRKAATFFLNAAKQAGIPVSPNFPKVRSSGTRKSNSNGSTKKKPPTGKRTAKKGKTDTGGDSYELELESGGTITVSIEVDLMQLMRHNEDREFVMGLVDSLDSYSDDEDDDGFDEDDDGDEL